MKNAHSLQRVGKAIARQRKQSNLTQAEVADRLGLSKESISRMETGSISPTLSRMFQFCELFDCRIGEFFWITESDVEKQVIIMLEMMRSLSETQRRHIITFLANIVRDMKELEG